MSWIYNWIALSFHHSDFRPFGVLLLLQFDSGCGLFAVSRTLITNIVSRFLLHLQLNEIYKIRLLLLQKHNRTIIPRVWTMNEHGAIYVCLSMSCVKVNRLLLVTRRLTKAKRNSLSIKMHLYRLFWFVIRQLLSVFVVRLLII